VNPKIAGKWMFMPLKMVLIGIDPYPNQNENMGSFRTMGPPRSWATRAAWIDISASNITCTAPLTRPVMSGAVEGGVHQPITLMNITIDVHPHK